MIAKVHKGADPGRLMAYLYSQERGREQHENPRQIGGTTISYDDPRAVASELRELAAERPSISKPIHHASLRVRAEEADRLDDAAWGQVADSYATEMGFSNSGWVAVRHGDDHVHFVGSRVDFDGQAVSDSHDYARAMRACRGIEAEHGLEAPDERQPKRTATLSIGERESHQRRRDAGQVQGRQEHPKMQLRAALEQARDRAVDRPDFERRAERAGVSLRPNESEKTGRMHGYSVSLTGHEDEHGEPVWMAASKVSRDLSWSQLGPTLERDDQEHERERDDYERGGHEL